MNKFKSKDEDTKVKYKQNYIISRGSFDNHIGFTSRTLSPLKTLMTPEQCII